MKNLKLTFNVQLSEFTDGEHPCHDTHIAGILNNRVIDSEIRIKLKEEELRYILDAEISKGFEHVKRQMRKELLTFKLKKTVREQIECYEKDIDELIPNYKLGLGFVNGVVRVFNITTKPFIGTTTDIYHPLSSNQYLTTKYEGMRSKLVDGTWTYGYQCSDFYSDIIERVEAPFDEKILQDYFKNQGVNYEMSVYTIQELPEVEPIQSNDYED